MGSHGRLAWTDAERARAKKECAGLVVKPRPRMGGRELHEHLQTLVMGNDRSSLRCLEAGLDRSNDPRTTQQVMEGYASPAPGELDIGTEAAAFTLMPRALEGGRMHGMAERARGLIIDRWVALAGLPFAMRAYLASRAHHLETVDVHHGPVEERIGAAWLGERPAEARLARWRSHLAFLHRVDEIFLGHLAAATEEERTSALASAEAARAGLVLSARAFVSAVFLVPDWIDADLREHVRVEGPDTERCPGYFPERSLSHASDPEAVGGYFSLLTAEEAVNLVRLYSLAGFPTTRRFVHAFLDKHRDRGVDPLLAWLRRIIELVRSRAPREFYGLSEDMLRATTMTLEALSAVHDSEALAEIALRVLRATQNAPKKLSPRPAATLCLQHSASFALPLVRELANKTHDESSWQWALLQQLERAADARSAAPPVEAPTAMVLPRANKAFRRPSFWTPEAFATLRDTAGHAVSGAALDTVGALLQERDEDKLAELRAVCEAVSLSAFVLSVMEAWNHADAPPKEKWALAVVGFLGDDVAAARLGALARVWPDEGAYQRAMIALVALARIGTMTALREIQMTAESTGYEPVRTVAKQKLAEVAQNLELSSDQLADRLIPNLGLDAGGKKTLSFGPRSFVVDFDERLVPFVVCAKGKRAKSLPKPDSSDAPGAIERASATFNAIKKGAKVAAPVHIARLERAMCSRRAWRLEEFREVLVGNPFIAHAVRRLVWTTEDEGASPMAVSVEADGSFSDVLGARVEPPVTALVRIAHGATFERAELAKWVSAFAKREMAQPFEQLSRRIFNRSELEAMVAELMGRTIEGRKIFALLGRGWRRGDLYDAGVFTEVTWQESRSMAVALHFLPGLSVAGSMAEKEPQRVETLSTSGNAADPTLATIEISEAGRELDLLTRP